MNVIIGRRRSGKSTVAVEWVLEDLPGRAIVVLDEQSRRSLLRQHGALDRSNVIVLPARNQYDELWDTGRDLVIDDADIVLQRFLSTRVVAIVIDKGQL